MVTPDSGYIFAGWSGDLSDAQNPTVIIMDAAKSASATLLEIPGGYCEAGGTMATGADVLANVQFNGINHIGDIDPVPSTGVNYTDYTNVATAVTTGQTYPLTVSLFHQFAPDQIFAWIDFNRDTIFDTSELVFASGVAFTNAEATGEVHIPQTASAGATRMRVRVQWDSLSAGDPCGTSFFGDVHDYSVIILKGPVLPTYTLTATAPNGELTIRPLQATYDSGQTVRLHLQETLGYRFSGWNGDLSGTDTPAVVVMTGNKIITADLTTTMICTLSTSADNASGAILLNPAGGVYNYGTEVSVTVQPYSGYIFTGWTGDLSGKDPEVDVVLNASMSVSAQFMEANTFYCSAGGQTGTGADYISAVTLGSIAKTTLRQTPGATLFYSDFTAYMTAVEKGQACTLGVALNHVFVPDRVFAWIDWNRDCLFDDNELVLSTGHNLSDVNVTGAFVVPDSAAAGITRMRVRVQFDSLSPANPCGTYLYGDVQDYSIIVKENTPVARPRERAGANAPAIRPSGRNAFLLTGRAGSAYAVYTMNGKTVRSGVLATGRARIDLDRCTRGLYLVRLMSGRQTTVSRIFVR